MMYSGGIICRARHICINITITNRFIITNTIYSS